MEGVRLIHCVDKPNNLRTLVKQDLREYNIKVPKLKKTRKLNQSRNSQDGQLASGIFGNSLSFVPSTYVPDCGFVPKFIVDAAEIIEEHSQMEGIFRKSGSVSRQKDLKQQVEEGQNLQSGSVHDVISLVKQFFRELPEPLFTSVFHDAFIRCYNLPAPKQLESLLLLCLLLPIEHLSTLRFMMGLLARVASKSAHNKMDVGNLAVVLAPNIMHVNSRSQKMNSTEEKLLQIQTAIVELLIHNASDIGVVSESLSQRTSLMTECFGTEDELDASDDNALEDSKDVKDGKKKRRKRSSSLQGLVSSINRGLSRLRRNSEGKNNVTAGSNYSLANDSDLAPQTSHYPPTTADAADQGESSLAPPSQPAATPVVIRKRRMSGDAAPFSATKRKAILEQLPHKSALGSTPFTPASSKKQDFRAFGRETPNIAFSEKSQVFSATPKTEAKNLRKKLNLFSPGSSRKAKRSKTAGSVSLCSNPMRKSSRTKHLFRRLSGNKDKDLAVEDEGERLPSPMGVPHSESAMELTSTSQLSGCESTLSVTRSVSSPSLHDLSTGSTHSRGERNALNQGFIDPDMTVASSALLDATSSGVCRSESVSVPSPDSRGRSLKREDAGRASCKPVRRSASTDGALRRGQPNKLCNGLMEGSVENVKKLRRSFDKSDISNPIPLIVPPLPEKPPSFDIRKDFNTLPDFAPAQGAKHKHHVSVRADKVKISGEKMEDQSCDVDSSLMQVVLPPPSGFGDHSVMEVDRDHAEDGSTENNNSDNESEAGFSTISGGTVIHRPFAGAGGSNLNSLQGGGEGKGASRNMACYGSSVSVSGGGRPPLQTSTSVDSLISTESESSAVGTGTGSAHFSNRPMDRSVSIDSGKGSLVDGVEMIPSSSTLNATYVMPPSGNRDPDSFSIRSEDAPMPDDKELMEQIGSRSIKSLSAEDLQSQSRTQQQKSAARSHSICVAAAGSGSGSGRHHANIVPNLQISAETHRLLARAGFLDGSLPPNVKDVAVPFKSPPRGEGSGGGDFSRDQPLARSFRLERPAPRKERTSLLHAERPSPVPEEVLSADKEKDRGRRERREEALQAAREHSLADQDRHRGKAEKRETAQGARDHSLSEQERSRVRREKREEAMEIAREYSLVERERSRIRREVSEKDSDQSLADGSCMGGRRLATEQQGVAERREDRRDGASEQPSRLRQVAQGEAMDVAEQEEVWVRRTEEESSGSCSVRSMQPTPATTEQRRGQPEEHHQPPPASIALKRAELRLQKHDSVLHIKEKRTGHVAQNVKQINRSLDHSSLDQSNNGSLHFQQCTSRKRGVSPVRIPSVFVKNRSANPSAAYYRELGQNSLRADGEAGHRPVLRRERAVEEGALESSQPLDKGRDDASALGNLDRRIEGAEVEADDFHDHHSTVSNRRSAGNDIDLSSSLLETIEDVITPHRKKRRSHRVSEGSSSPLHESTNTKVSGSGSSSTSSAVSSSSEDKANMRTSKGLTPHQLLRYGSKVAGSDRSPGKPVKRLQSSPRSPHGRHSPLRHSPQKQRERNSLLFRSHDFDEKY